MKTLNLYKSFYGFNVGANTTGTLNVLPALNIIINKKDYHFAGNIQLHFCFINIHVWISIPTSKPKQSF